MAKYKVLKVERDDAVARALEAERLSRVEEVQRLEAALGQAQRECDRERATRVYLENTLAAITGTIEQINQHLRAAKDREP
jgi:hypothetical protein